MIVAVIPGKNHQRTWRIIKIPIFKIEIIKATGLICNCDDRDENFQWNWLSMYEARISCSRMMKIMYCCYIIIFSGGGGYDGLFHVSNESLFFKNGRTGRRSTPWSFDANFGRTPFIHIDVKLSKFFPLRLKSRISERK